MVPESLNPKVVSTTIVFALTETSLIFLVFPVITKSPVIVGKESSNPTNKNSL